MPNAQGRAEERSAANRGALFVSWGAGGEGANGYVPIPIRTLPPLGAEVLSEITYSDADHTASSEGQSNTGLPSLLTPEAGWRQGAPAKVSGGHPSSVAWPGRGGGLAGGSRNIALPRFQLASQTSTSITDHRQVDLTAVRHLLG